MNLRYSIGAEKCQIYANWTTVNGKSSIFQNIVIEVGKKHGINVDTYHKYANTLDGLTDKLYEQIDLFTSEHSGVPYNPKLRRTITHAFYEISNSIETFQLMSESQEHKLFAELFAAVLDKLHNVVNIYLTDFAYQSKYRERLKTKEQYIELTNPVDLSVEFEDELLQTIYLSALLECLTKTQQARFFKHVFLKCTFQEIANSEGVSWQSVQESIVTSRKKLKQRLQRQCSDRNTEQQ